MQKLRADFRELIAALKTKRFKFVDETGLNLAFTRLYGRAAPGVRVVDSVPGDHGGNHTLVAAVGLQGVSAPWLIEGALNGELFELWVREVLGPTLARGELLFWDNLAAHKVAGVAVFLKERGVRLIPLSPYSPDFNPIEKCWSKIKPFLRQAKARTVEALLEALNQALETITPADIRGWFRSCGYPVH